MKSKNILEALDLAKELPQTIEEQKKYIRKYRLAGSYFQSSVIF